MGIHAQAQNSAPPDFNVSNFCQVPEAQSIFSDNFVLPNGLQVRVDLPNLQIRPSLLAQQRVFTQALTNALSSFDRESLPALQGFHFILNLSDDDGTGAAFCTNMQRDPLVPIFLVNRRTLSEAVQLSRLFAHELTHWLIYRNFPNHGVDLPRWLEEGLATLQEYHLTGEPRGPWLLATMRRPHVGLTGLETAQVMNDPIERLAAYGQVSLFLIYLEKISGGGVTFFDHARNEAFVSAMETIKLYVKKYTPFESLNDAFLAYSVAKAVNRPSPGEAPALSATYIFFTSEPSPVFKKTVALQPWSSILVGQNETEPKPYETDFWINNSHTEKITYRPWALQKTCPFRECLRLRLRFD